MKIGIVIIHWRELELTRSKLSELTKWSKIKPLIALVQNQHNKDAFPDIENASITKIINAANLGFGAANNLGIDALNKQEVNYILLLNTDAKIEEEEVQKLIDFAEEDDQLFSCGPLLIELHDRSMKKFAGGLDISENMITRLPFTEKMSKQGKLDVDYNIGAIVLLNSKLLNQVGGFDPQYFFSGEMADLCYRAKNQKLNCKTLLSCTGYHYCQPSQLRNSLYKYYSLRNRMVFIKKHHLGFAMKWKWYKIAIKELVYQIWRLNGTQIKVVGLSLLHMFFGVKGNQNKYFNKVIH